MHPRERACHVYGTEVREYYGVILRRRGMTALLFQLVVSAYLA